MQFVAESKTFSMNHTESGPTNIQRIYEGLSRKVLSSGQLRPRQQKVEIGDNNVTQSQVIVVGTRVDWEFPISRFPSYLWHQRDSFIPWAARCTFQFDQSIPIHQAELPQNSPPTS